MRIAISRISRIATPTTLICAVLSIGSTAWAQTDSWERTDNWGRADMQKACSNGTLRGDYGYAAEGVLIDNPGLPKTAQFRSVGTTHFDGQGSLTWLERTVINGKLQNSDWTAASGTYAVNANCTGTAVVVTPNSPVPLYLAFVVVHQGKEVHAVLESNAISTVFKKVE